MIMPRVAAVACLVLSLSAAPLPAMQGPSGLADAMAELRSGSYLRAAREAEAAGPVAADVIEWLRLRDDNGTFDQVAAFLARRPDWPGLARLRRQSEDMLPARVTDDATAEAILGFYGESAPSSSDGVIALIGALRHKGEEDAARDVAVMAWASLPLTEVAETTLRRLYPDETAAQNDDRVEAMFWARAGQSLSRAVARSAGETRDLGEARLAVLSGADVATARARLPEALRDDPGLAHEAFRRHVAAGRDEAASRVAREQGANLGNPEAWADARRDLARAAMRADDYQEAYDLAAPNGLSEGADFADLEWIAGYMALRFLDRPEDALRHFEALGEGVASPISLGRAGYWRGRAHEALGEPGAARDAYADGAAYQSSFYGLLSAEKLGRSLDPDFAGAEVHPPAGSASFAGSSVLEAALLLQAAGERDLSEWFLTHLSESLPAGEIGALADLVLDLGEPHIALMIAKAAAMRGITLPRAYFPVVELGVENMPVEPALALAIARRESEFDPGVASGAGARGLMQLMPGTARDVTRELGLRYDSQRLFTDPSYNATLGTAYLRGLIDRFGPSPVLVAAGYNAGPGRPLQWMGERGDPRGEDIDVVDWIEFIPFTETRNYVMRVAESLPIYRARLGGTLAPLEFTRELQGR